MPARGANQGPRRSRLPVLSVGIPFALLPSFIYYNKALFDEAKLPYPPHKVGEKYNGKDWNLDTMVELASDGITMLVVTHEMGFARQVADRIIFMDDGQIVEINTPKNFFENPQHERAKLFLQQILH